jgi:hypothetical protein
MCIFHKWSKWEEYVAVFVVYPGVLYPENMQGKPFQMNERWQKRTCLKCGYTQRRKVEGE